MWTMLKRISWQLTYPISVFDEYNFSVPRQATSSLILNSRDGPFLNVKITNIILADIEFKTENSVQRGFRIIVLT